MLDDFIDFGSINFCIAVNENNPKTYHLNPFLYETGQGLTLGDETPCAPGAADFGPRGYKFL